MSDNDSDLNLNTPPHFPGQDTPPPVGADTPLTVTMADLNAIVATNIANALAQERVQTNIVANALAAERQAANIALEYRLAQLGAGAAAHGAPNAAAHAAHNAGDLAPPMVRPSMSVVAKEISSGKHTTSALPPWDITKSQVKNLEVACKPFGGYLTGNTITIKLG
jgi:hypothetical protein